VICETVYITEDGDLSQRLVPFNTPHPSEEFPLVSSGLQSEGKTIVGDTTKVTSLRSLPTVS
jgi:antitoxin (DNA-binding transcriptional repressor) of toxin-antitoxin stability system